VKSGGGEKKRGGGPETPTNKKGRKFQTERRDVAGGRSLVIYPMRGGTLKIARWGEKKSGRAVIIDGIKNKNGGI